MLLTVNVMSAQQKDASIAVVDSAVYDFGEINEKGGPITHTFKIRNDGEIALVVTKVVASCGCTTPDWTKDPIAPGKTGEIKVTYDPENRPGPFTKTVSVYSNGKAGSFILTIRGTVVSK
jgi:alpha-tubulin suppressor-like RCC1 family protein